MRLAAFYFLPPLQLTLAQTSQTVFSSSQVNYLVSCFHYHTVRQQDIRLLTSARALQGLGPPQGPGVMAAPWGSRAGPGPPPQPRAGWRGRQWGLPQPWAFATSLGMGTGRDGTPEHARKHRDTSEALKATEEQESSRQYEHHQKNWSRWSRAAKQNERLPLLPAPIIWSICRL